MADDALRLPDFLLIGAMKSGTTTLYEYLCRHPRVFMCTPKEPGFFSREEVFSRGLDWYAGLFADAGPDRICGEASTCYSRWPHYGDVAARIAEHLPDVKLVYLMRHPVDRAYSHYRHTMQERETPLSFEQAIEADAEIVDASRYRLQIEQFLAHFPREQLHCLLLEDLQRDPDETLEPLQRFLGLEPVSLTAAGPVTANPEGTGVALRSAQEAIRSARRVPVLSAFARRLPDGARSRFKGWLKSPRVAARLFRKRVDAKREGLTPLAEKTRGELLRRLSASTNEIATFLGRDLADWQR